MREVAIGTEEGDCVEGVQRIPGNEEDDDDDEDALYCLRRQLQLTTQQTFVLSMVLRLRRLLLILSLLGGGDNLRQFVALDNNTSLDKAFIFVHSNLNWFFKMR